MSIRLSIPFWTRHILSRACRVVSSLPLTATNLVIYLPKWYFAPTFVSLINKQNESSLSEILWMKSCQIPSWYILNTPTTLYLPVFNGLNIWPSLIWVWFLWWRVHHQNISKETFEHKARLECQKLYCNLVWVSNYDLPKNNITNSKCVFHFFLLEDIHVFCLTSDVFKKNNKWLLSKFFQ